MAAGMENIEPDRASTAAASEATVRKLVTVRRIASLSKVDRRHQLAHVDGWTMVVEKAVFEAGQLVVFFQIDAFVPGSDGRFWLYWADGKDTHVNGELGHRVRSQSWGKHLSQGIIFPLSTFPEIENRYEEMRSTMDEDKALKTLMARSFEAELGVIKWENEVSADGKRASLGRPPTFFSQPGWDRAQDKTNLFSSYMRNTVFQISEKMDGETMSVYAVAKGSKWYKALPPLPANHAGRMENELGRIGVTSRTHDFIDTGKANMYWEVARGMGILDKIQTLGFPNIVLQGELLGTSIQKNSLDMLEGEHTFLVFNICNLDDHGLIPVKQAELICRRHGIAYVPVLSYTRLGDFASNLDQLLKKADGTTRNGAMREGLVFRSLNGKDRFKVVSNQWLIKTGK